MATSERPLWTSFGLVRNHVALLSKPSRTIVFVILLAGLPLLLPRLQSVLPLKGEAYREVLPHFRELIAFDHHSASASTIQVSSDRVESPSPVKEIGETCASQLIEDPEHTMDQFNAALIKTESKTSGAITRIAHYGDSPITNDGITGTTRKLLQQRFGDAGHGFILIDRPWDWYSHQAITFSSGGGWVSGSLMNPQTRDGEFGFGGVAFFANGPGRYAKYEPARDGDTGKKFSRFEVYYLMHPEGGQFSVSINDKQEQVVSTAREADTSGFSEVKSVGPVSSFSLKSLSGSLRLFGVVLENDDAGVVYDSLGVNGAFAGLLATAMNEQHWAEQLRHRNPNLVILNYGTNESEYASDDQMQRYERELREAVRRVRVALPNTSILIVSPMDRGKRAPGGRVVTMPSIPKIVEMQRRVAHDTHCAFLDIFNAMGVKEPWDAGMKDVSIW